MMPIHLVPKGDGARHNRCPLERLTPQATFRGEDYGEREQREDSSVMAMPKGAFGKNFHHSRQHHRLPPAAAVADAVKPHRLVDYPPPSAASLLSSSVDHADDDDLWSMNKPGMELFLGNTKYARYARDNSGRCDEGSSSLRDLSPSQVDLNKGAVTSPLKTNKIGMYGLSSDKKSGAGGIDCADLSSYIASLRRDIIRDSKEKREEEQKKEKEDQEEGKDKQECIEEGAQGDDQTAQDQEQDAPIGRSKSCCVDMDSDCTTTTNHPASTTQRIPKRPKVERRLSFICNLIAAGEKRQQQQQQDHHEDDSATQDAASTGALDGKHQTHEVQEEETVALTTDSTTIASSCATEEESAAKRRDAALRSMRLELASLSAQNALRERTIANLRQEKHKLQFNLDDLKDEECDLIVEREKFHGHTARIRLLIDVRAEEVCAARRAVFRRCGDVKRLERGLRNMCTVWDVMEEYIPSYRYCAPLPARQQESAYHQQPTLAGRRRDSTRSLVAMPTRSLLPQDASSRSVLSAPAAPFRPSSSRPTRRHQCWQQAAVPPLPEELIQGYDDRRGLLPALRRGAQSRRPLQRSSLLDVFGGFESFRGGRFGPSSSDGAGEVDIRGWENKRAGMDDAAAPRNKTSSRGGRASSLLGMFAPQGQGGTGADIRDGADEGPKRSSMDAAHAATMKKRRAGSRRSLLGFFSDAGETDDDNESSPYPTTTQVNDYYRSTRTVLGYDGCFSNSSSRKASIQTVASTVSMTSLGACSIETGLSDVDFDGSI